MTVLLLAACGQPGPKQGWEDWYDPGTTLGVTEAIDFTDVPYDFTGETPIADLPIPGDFETWFASDDPPPAANCDGWSTTSELPAEIEGIVTIHPRYYIKVNGCAPDDFAIDNEEKYYGSFFVQDASGGFFVLGDSKVAHFDMGDRVKIDVRAVKSHFDSVMISAHDVLEVTRGPLPIYYRESADMLGAVDIGDVVRVRGTVAAEISTFGELYLCTGDAPDTTLAPDPGRMEDLVPRCAHLSVTDPPWFKVGLDVELNRRGVTWDPGTEIEATGPVILSFGDHQVVVMRVGQVAVLDP